MLSCAAAASTAVRLASASRNAAKSPGPAEASSAASSHGEVARATCNVL